MSYKVNETEDFRLHTWIEWRAKPKTKECPCCHGRGEVGGGFKDIDGARKCPDCHGRGTITEYSKAPEPPLPEGLMEHMRRAYWDYVNDPKNLAKQE